MNRANEADERQRSYHEELSQEMGGQGNEAYEQWRSYHEGLSDYMDE